MEANIETEEQTGRRVARFNVEEGPCTLRPGKSSNTSARRYIGDIY